MEHVCKNEIRIAQLEGDTRVNNNSINNLINTLNNLTGEVKWLIRLSFTTLLSMILSILGFLIVQLIKF